MQNRTGSRGSLPARSGDAGTEGNHRLPDPSHFGVLSISLWGIISTRHGGRQHSSSPSATVTTSEDGASRQTEVGTAFHPDQKTIQGGSFQPRARQGTGCSSVAQIPLIPHTEARGSILLLAITVLLALGAKSLVPRQIVGSKGTGKDTQRPGDTGTA